MSRPSARRRAALAAGGLVVVALVAAQLVLPDIAARRLRHELQASGSAVHVAVHAFPAIELLGHRADRVDVRLGDLRAGTGRLSSLIEQAAGVGTLHASAATLTSGPLTVRDATLTKRGSLLTASALVRDDDLRSAVPGLDSVRPVASGGGALVLRGTATLLGITASVDAVVEASRGRLLVAPDVPLGGLATVVVFADPRLAVEHVSARRAPGGFTVSVSGRLRG